MDLRSWLIPEKSNFGKPEILKKAGRRDGDYFTEFTKEFSSYQTFLWYVMFATNVNNSPPICLSSTGSLIA